jgi:hypothetical protein
MKTGKRFSPEIRERSVRMVFDQEREYSSQWACIESIAGNVVVEGGIIDSEARWIPLETRK